MELFVFFAELLGNGLEALTNNCFVLSFGILHHIIFIGAYNVSLNLQHLIHLLCIHESLNSIRHSSYDCIVQQFLPHNLMQCRRNRSFIVKVLFKLVDYLRGYSVSPEKFLEVQGVHINNGFISNRDGFRLVTIAIYTEQ